MLVRFVRWIRCLWLRLIRGLRFMVRRMKLIWRLVLLLVVVIRLKFPMRCRGRLRMSRLIRGLIRLYFRLMTCFGSCRVLRSFVLIGRRGGVMTRASRLGCRICLPPWVVSRLLFIRMRCVLLLGASSVLFGGWLMSMDLVLMVVRIFRLLFIRIGRWIRRPRLCERLMLRLGMRRGRLVLTVCLLNLEW